MKRLHLVFGIVVLFVFALTGQYMDHAAGTVFHVIAGLSDRP